MLKRAAFLAYGILCYSVFLGTFLYALGFVGGFGVERQLDGAPTDPLPVALLVDTGLLALFAVQHSLMARRGFKQVWTRLVPTPIERSTYVLFSSLALLLMFWQWRPLGGSVWAIQNAAARTALFALFAFGWGLVLVSTFLINHFDLFGLRQVWLYARGRPYTSLGFATPGPYRLVRHPLYAGWLFAFWMTPAMTLSHLLFALATTAYILIAIRLEERDLLHFHPVEYAAYRRRVPMLWPFRRSQQADRATETRSSPARA
jgi:protein-S-isoprenylcysteine O-methyltransferase Ste14